MNVEQLLQKDSSKGTRDNIVRYVGNDPDRFTQLIDIFLRGPYRITQRAAWPISYCIQNNPSLAYPHLQKLVECLTYKNQLNAVKRNILRLLQFVEIPKSLHGELTKICFDFLLDSTQQVAIRVFAMTVLSQIAKRHSDLGTELKMILEDRMDYESAGFRSRAKKILKSL